MHGPFSYVGDNLASRWAIRWSWRTKSSSASSSRSAVRTGVNATWYRKPVSRWCKTARLIWNAAPTGVTAERQSRWAFSYGFIYVKGQLLIAKNSSIQAYDDLRDKNNVTLAGTTNERFLRANADHKMNMNVISAKDHGEAFR